MLSLPSLINQPLPTSAKTLMSAVISYVWETGGGMNFSSLLSIIGSCENLDEIKEVVVWWFNVEEEEEEGVEGEELKGECCISWGFFGFSRRWISFDSYPILLFLVLRN